MPDHGRRTLHRVCDSVSGVNWRPTRFVDELMLTRYACCVCHVIPSTTVVLPCCHALCEQCQRGSVVQDGGCVCPLDGEPFSEDECQKQQLPERKKQNLKLPVPGRAVGECSERATGRAVQHPLVPSAGVGSQLADARAAFELVHLHTSRRPHGAEDDPPRDASRLRLSHGVGASLRALLDRRAARTYGAERCECFGRLRLRPHRGHSPGHCSRIRLDRVP
nr:TNF receptor-associated factor 6-like [Dermacentor andersoni]